MSNLISLSSNYGLMNSMFNTNTTGKKNAINTLWNNYASSSGFSSSDTSGINAANLYGVKSTYSELVSTYNTASDAFYKEFDSSMADLKSAAKGIKETDFHVGENAVTKNTSLNEDGETVTTKTYSKELQAALDSVKELVDSYNSANKLLSDHASLSNRLKNVSSMFSDTTARSELYESIGISVGSGGTLTVDEDQLVDAITNDPNKVSRILGKDGLAGKAESHAAQAENQRDRLFPALSSMYGSQVKTAQAYTGKAASSMLGYANVGNLMNMFF